MMELSHSFDDIFNIGKFVNDPKVPVNQLLKKSSKGNAVDDPMTDGMVPISGLLDKSQDVRDANDPMNGGIFPFN
jgi:hypothetical protein